MTFLRLPRIAAANAQATQSAVAAGLNGVTPEIRQHALRKVRAAIRNGRVRPAKVERALERGDAGLASLFPVGQMPSTPAIPASALSTVGGSERVAKALDDCSWVIELAMRRGVDTSELAEALSGGTLPTNAAHLLVATWNRLLDSYRPDWLPAEVTGDRAKLMALPEPLRREHADPRALFTIEPTSLCRMFVTSDTPEFNLVLHALRKLEEATHYPLAAFDPDRGRECYMEYSMGGSMLDDLAQIAIWPDGADEPTFDTEAVANLLDEFGHEPESAEYFIEAATHELVRERKLKAAPKVDRDPELRHALKASQSSNAKLARIILALARRIKALPAPPNAFQHDFCGFGLPVHLLSTWDCDSFQDELSNAIDTECGDEAPSITFMAATQSLSKIDAALRRLIPEMLVSDYVYGLMLADHE